MLKQQMRRKNEYQKIQKNNKMGRIKKEENYKICFQNYDLT